jgi:hypothetical protein
LFRASRIQLPALHAGIWDDMLSKSGMFPKAYYTGKSLKNAAQHGFKDYKSFFSEG